MSFFRHLSSLRELNMGSVKVNGLPSGLFSNLKDLRKLELYGLKIGNLPYDILFGLNKLDSSH